MKGHVINLDGQLVCIFPFTNATEFERMAHNDLPSLCIVGDESGLPLEVVEDNDCRGRHFGWCFLSCPVSWTRRPIMERDRGDIAALALENDAWAAEQVKETDRVVSSAGYTDDTIFRLCIDDVQSVAFNYYGRELTDGEIARCREKELDLSLNWSEGVEAWLTSVVFPDGIPDDPVAEAELESEERLAEIGMQDDEGHEREFNVQTIETWTVLVDYKVTATSKQSAKDAVEEGHDYLDKEVLEWDVKEWKSVEEA